MNDSGPSLELTEVSARFNEAEGMLQEARERLQAILLHERRREEAADSLSVSARAVTEFATRADQVLEEAARAVSASQELLEMGQHLLSGNAIDDVDQRVAKTLEQVQQLQTAEAETMAAVKENTNARAEDHQNSERVLAELQQRVSDIARGVTSNRRAVWFALAAMLGGQIVVAVLGLLT